MKSYKGYRYFLGKDGLWRVLLEGGGEFVVALDDSKRSGKRKIVWEKNTEKTCKEFIDWVVS